MQRVNYNSLKFLEYFDNLNPQNSGIFFSILFHLIILLFAVGLPNFFGPKDVYVPNIIPIEILNVSDTTNIEKTKSEKEVNKNTKTKQKKFNSSNNTEVQKQYKLDQNLNNTNNQNVVMNDVQEKKIIVKEKKLIKTKEKEISNNMKVETIKTKEIKPKLKPKPKKTELKKVSDVQIEPQPKKTISNEKKDIVTAPKQKPKEDFSIASMLKDLRNEKSNNVKEDEIIKENKNQVNNDKTNENMILSISEYDLLRQQLSSCWNAPAGAVINVGDKVTISAKVQQNMKVFENSVRIVDTNISKSNPFYGPITDSAMRTLLNPECTPLKLPKEKYNLWKNLTITFDYSIMKGY